MKHFNKHTISIILMSSSIALLLVFQCFWLKKVYDEQRMWLKKEADDLLHSTVMFLQDSLIQTQIDTSATFQNNTSNSFTVPNVAADSNLNLKADTIVMIDEGATHFYKFKVDSIAMPPSFNHNSEYLQLRKALRNKWRSSIKFRRNITSDFQNNTDFLPDSLRSIAINRTLKRVILNMQNRKGEQRFIIRLGSDSIRMAAVERVYKQKLQAANLPIAFKIKKHHLPDVDLLDKELFVGPIPTGMPPRDLFTATLLDYNNYLMQKTLPQFLFSIFLTSITFLSFWLIYRSLRQQQRLAILKNDFISNITHELKTPIATVSVAIEALRNFNALQNPQLTKEYLDISKNELNRLTILVDKVLKMAIFEQTAPELRFETFNFSEMVAQIIDSMKLQFEKYNANVHLITNDEVITMNGDRIHLTSVIYNLLDNALKYSKENPEINIHIKSQNGQLQLAVQDNGIGIPGEYKNRIFEKFFRVPTGDVHNVKGYGLGLNYVSSVVKQHGGSIEVESEAAEGSTFTVHLPRGKE
jgi:two-component system, OmpR family, phosphate regulon sensor histidine kinase PhoR